MSDDECVHGMNPAWCANCADRRRAAAPPSEAGADRIRSKQNLVNDLCDVLGLPRHHFGPGSTLPQGIFRAAATRAKVRHGTMPKVGAAIARKAGLVWGPDCANLGTHAGANPTVTREGLDVMVNADHAADRIDLAFGYIFDHLGDPEIRLAGAARLVGMSESAFSRYFTKISGQSFGTTVRKLRLAHAGKLLRETALPVAAIAHRVGYANLSNFNRQFRSQHGRTPSQLRGARPDAEQESISSEHLQR